MTKPTIKSAKLAALNMLSKVIMDRLQHAGPAGLTIPELTQGLGFATSTVRARVALLAEAGRVYRERHFQAPRNAIVYTWHAAVLMPEEMDTDASRRTLARTYPQNNARDPLVSALFGPVRKEGA